MPISIFLFSPKFHKFLRFVWEDKVYTFKTMPIGLSTAPLVSTRIFQAVVAHLYSQSIFIHSYLDDSLLKNVPISSERSYPFCDRVAPQTGFPNFMEEVGASTQPRLHFSRGTLSDRPGTSFPPRGKNCIVTLQFLVNKFFQISSVPARQFLQLIGFLISLMDVIPLGRLHI